MKKKNKTYTVTQLNKMMMRDDLTLWETIEACAFIDICDCYEPMFYPPKEQEDEWRRMCGEYEPEPTLENTSFYVTEPDGTKYFIAAIPARGYPSSFLPTVRLWTL